ncbi:hypothetical protein ABPG74_008816 [Tetrahymena malaccensis]
MFDIQIREIKEKVYQHLIQLIPLQVTPNQVTLASFVFGIFSAIFCYYGKYTLGLYFWLMNRFLDGLDGTLARFRNQQTDFGGYLDIIVDFIVYSIIPISIAMRKNNISVYISLSFMLATFFVNAAGLFYLSALLEKRNFKNRKELTSVTLPPALVEGLETFIFYTLFFVFNREIQIFYWIFGLGVCITIYQRLDFAKKVLK